MLNKSKILIADDSEINRALLGAFLENKYSIVEVEDGIKAIEYLKANKDVAILLLDLHMPLKDGFEVLEAINKMGLSKTMPVIIISGEDAVDMESRAFDLGAIDFIHKPFDGRLVCQRVDNIVELFSSRNKLEEKVLEQTKELRIKNEKLNETNRRIIDILGTTVEFRHLDSFQHIKRVKAFTKCIANQMLNDFPDCGLTKEKVDLIVAASSLHDIGKIAINDAILLKPGRLDKDEFEIMKTHTTKGGEILKSVDGIWDDDFAKACYDICMYHHERYDGRGYPKGLKGEDIPLSAQLVSIVDVYDALVCKRVYKDAIPKDEASRMILEGECGTFSPKLIECFRNCKESLEHLADTIIDKDV